jgi:hypothetical protein
MENPARAAEFKKWHAEFIKLQRDSMVGGSQSSPLKSTEQHTVRSASSGEIVKRVRSVASPEGIMIMISGCVVGEPEMTQPLSTVVALHKPCGA